MRLRGSKEDTVFYIRTAGAAAAALLLVVAAFASPALADSPYPPQCDISEPLRWEQASEAIPNLVGIHGGVWDKSELSHTLIVERVSEDKAVSGYYAHGIYKEWGINSPGCYPFSGVITAKNELFIRFPSAGIYVWYRATDDGLAARYKQGNASATGTFKRVLAETASAG